MITANVSGRLAFDARTIETRSNKPMTTARLAVDDGADHTIWIDLLAFNDLAVWLARCAKGDRVSAMGLLKLNQWTDQRTGEAKECLQLVVDNMLCNAPKPRKQKQNKGDYA
jgi:single-stranded DNA-binding protein